MGFGGRWWGGVGLESGPPLLRRFWTDRWTDRCVNRRMDREGGWGVGGSGTGEAGGKGKGDEVGEG